MADGFKSVVLVAREAAEARMRAKVASHGEDDSVRRELVKSFSSHIEHQFLDRIAFHMHDGSLHAVAAIGGLPFNAKAPGPPATDSGWLLLPEDQKKALELLGQLQLPEPEGEDRRPVFTIPARVHEIPSALRAMPAEKEILVREEFVGRNNLTKTSTAAAYSEELQRIKVRQGCGYFTVCEAAQILSDSRKSSAKEMLQTMCRSILSGDLMVRRPEDRQPKEAVSTIVKKEDLPQIADDRIVNIAWKTGIQVSSDFLKDGDIDQWLERRSVDYRFPLVAIAPPSAEGQSMTRSTQAQSASAETTDQRCARLLKEFRAEQSVRSWGALARVAERDGRARQTVSADIERAKKSEAAAASPIGTVTRSLAR